MSPTGSIVQYQYYCFLLLNLRVSRNIILLWEVLGPRIGHPQMYLDDMLNILNESYLRSGQ